MPAAVRVQRVLLQDFRSYRTLDLAVAAPLVALSGENGAGKTNLLEALSLFAQGRGLRRAAFADMARQGGSGGFTVAITVTDGTGGEHRLGCGYSAGPGTVPGMAGGEMGAERLNRIDGRPAPSAGAFADYLRLVWLTPEQDGLFRGPAGDRRRFLDRLVLAVDASHGARVQALERTLRTRNRLLDERPDDDAWLSAVEHEAAEAGIAIAAARAESVARLAALIAEEKRESSLFPWAEIALEGEIDQLVAELPALEAEEVYRGLLRDNRARDRAAGRTLIGPQASDLAVRHGPKQVAASLASTGEQKALLIGLVLAQARLVTGMSGLAPLVLLDEIAAHLDPGRRAALYDDLRALGCQVWMTGADPALFDDLPRDAARLMVAGGQVQPHRS